MCHADIKEGRGLQIYKGGKGVADTKEVRGVACRYKGGKGCCMQI